MQPHCDSLDAAKWFVSERRTSLLVGETIRACHSQPIRSYESDLESNEQPLGLRSIIIAVDGSGCSPALAVPRLRRERTTYSNKHETTCEVCERSWIACLQNVTATYMYDAQPQIILAKVAFASLTRPHSSYPVRISVCNWRWSLSRYQFRSLVAICRWASLIRHFSVSSTRDEISSDNDRVRGCPFLMAINTCAVHNRSPAWQIHQMSSCTFENTTRTLRSMRLALSFLPV